ncbi:hypothetical protein FB45DRAFT_1009169 [Roridomyces roridus]|uniref:Uncharacterized protein n=1 Tax=Roridomyces roridus TaxID=1738132 RepID=A0AAD7FB24_9AGAR|nr:hypothetical protein FB45DRAFT_1009169 [Roridomyces roridus]
MTFHIAYVPTVLVCIAVAIKLQDMATFQPPVGTLMAEYIKSCPEYGTGAINDFLCIIEPFFKDLVTNEIGKAFLTAFGTSGAVMSTHLLLRGGRSDASVFFSPLITAAVVLAGQVLGAGFVQLALVPLFLAISKTLTAPKSTAAPSPPPSFVYIATTLVIQFTVFAISMGLSGVPPSNPAWVQINYAFQAFPILFLPLFFLSFIPTSKSEPTPTLGVSALTFFKFIYAPLWWVTLAQGFNAYLRAGEPFTPPCYFMALDLFAFVLSFVGMYAVDAVAGDAPMAVPRMLGGLLVFGPASTMAAYFGKQESMLVEQVQAGKRRA